MKLIAIWSIEAQKEFHEIYEYWVIKNHSDTFSRKLWKLTNKTITTIEKKPKLGVLTNSINIRMRLISKNYYLIYKTTETHIEILKFWDVRQDPIKNQYIK